MGKSDTTSLFHVSFHEKKKLSKCDARVLVCYGCSLNFKRNWQGPLPQFDFIIVKKLRRLGMKYLATPSNAYFMLFVIILFINPLNVFSVSIWHLMLRIWSKQQHCLKRYIEVFKDLLWEAQVLEIDVSRLVVFLSFACLYSWGHFICRVA